ncbi:hypothetical protein ACQW02_08485 [Humitalea sp. 24SJ18S-53]|uniref:hypothetical protein n=1 Tax=Humitalea sp. 24SJ18S-53 TaxID=3422307 RepID=UPI003D676469
MTDSIQYSIFSVCDEPHCVWGWDLAERNIRFVNGIDDAYFDYIADTHQQHLNGKYAQQASIALRANYHLCLETLFGLIGATLQAPDCVVGWVLKANTYQLRTLVSSLCNNNMNFPVKWEISTEFKGIGFTEVAKIVMGNTVWSNKIEDNTVEKFATLWGRLAVDFLDPHAISEYNSIKHGFRMRSGGFSVRVGREHEFGVPPPEEEMESIGGSEFGTSFYMAEAVYGAPKVKRDPHFMLRQHSLNWLPDSTAGRMLLACQSIHNLRACLSIANGRSPSEVIFQRCRDAGDFDKPWRRSTGVTHSSMDFTVCEADIQRATHSELRSFLISNCDDRKDENE